MDRKTVITALATLVLLGLGLGLDTSKDVAKHLYCSIQPQDCSQE